MGILQRFSDIMRSNINALLSKCEDPAKLIDQTLLDLRRDLAEVKQDTAKVMADEKAALRKLEDCQAEIAKYTTAAQNALKSGNEEDARKLITRKQQIEGSLPALQTAYDLSKANAEKMRQLYSKLTSDIEELESRKDAIKAKVSAAKAQQKMNEMVAGSPDVSASLEAFDRMEAKADKMLDAAMAEAELNAGTAGTGALVDKYTKASDSTVEDELAAMKASLGI